MTISLTYEEIDTVQYALRIAISRMEKDGWVGLSDGKDMKECKELLEKLSVARRDYSSLTVEKKK